MSEIEQRDPSYHRQLETLIEGPSSAERVEAAEAIFRALFRAEHVVPRR